MTFALPDETGSFDSYTWMLVVAIRLAQALVAQAAHGSRAPCRHADVIGRLALATAWLHWTWRTLFQAPWFRAARAFLRAVLGAYSLAGNGVKSPQWFFGYRPPVTSSRIRPACWRALCSAPCTRPFLGGAMTFALTPPTVPSWRCSWRGRGSGLALSRTVDAQRLEYRAVSTGRCAYNT